jgi:hypothetical protein
MDGWSGTVEHGPIPAYGRLGRRIYERARDRAAWQRRLFDAATPEQLDAARTWLVDVNRDHESEDASPREIFHTIERQYRPDGWLGFLAGLEES